MSFAIKDVVAAALKGGTDSVVLCHNHPNGVALPSREDLQATENIVRALGLVRVHLRDHIILTETESFSMREENRLQLLFHFLDIFVLWFLTLVFWLKTMRFLMH